jgi:hypothetical protein
MIQLLKGKGRKTLPFLESHKSGIRGNGVRFLRGWRKSYAQIIAIAQRLSRQTHPGTEESVTSNLSFSLGFDATIAFCLADAKNKATGASKVERSYAAASR